MHHNPPLNVQRDFTPISLLATAPLVLLTQANSPIRTLADLVKEAKAKPEALSYGTPGIGTPHHISGEMLQKATGIKLTQITYRGTAPSLNDLMAGTIPLIIATTISYPRQVPFYHNGSADTAPAKFRLVMQIVCLVPSVIGVTRNVAPYVPWSPRGILSHLCHHR
jgi:tripartite-type tricarboxylate transporter receptor subunit TctC